MPTATLHFDVASGYLIIEADSPLLAQNPLLNAYVRSTGGAIATGELRVPADQSTLHQIFQDVSTLLGRVGFELEMDSQAGEALQRVRADERAFEVFSAAAAAIWNGAFQPEHFKEFVETVEKASPGRVFYARQLLASYHLAFAQNACNFSVPGAGKTSIVYAAYLYLKTLPVDDPKHVSRILIVGPLSSFKAWEDEFEEITLRRANSKRLAGFTPVSDRHAYLRGVSFEERETELTLTSYSTLASSEPDFQRFLARSDRRTMIVLDEAHNIKREDGHWSAAALRLAPQAAARVVLTGTPAPNGYEDLTNLFRFIYPKRNIIGFSSSTLRAMSGGAMPGAVERLKDRVKPFYTRIRKSDLGLPHADEQRVHVALSSNHGQIYTKIERALMPQIRAAAQGAQSSLVRARLMRLRQAAVNPSLLLRPLSEEGLLDPSAANAFSASELEVADLVSRFDPANDLVRLDETCRLVRQVLDKQRKIVVWSYFIGNLHLLKEHLIRQADYVEILTGATPVATGLPDDGNEEDLETREAIINRFHSETGRSILIANPQAVGESISLHKAARTAIYFDRDFNAGRFIQSKDRIHRYNPEPLGSVDYYFLVASGTVDVVIDQRLTFKEQRLIRLIESEDIPLFGLLEDEAGDIAAILDDYERRKAV